MIYTEVEILKAFIKTYPEGIKEQRISDDFSVYESMQIMFSPEMKIRHWIELSDFLRKEKSGMVLSVGLNEKNEKKEISKAG